MRLSTNVIRNFAAVAVSLVIATAGLSTVAAQEKPKASPPVLVTSLGQSLDAFQIQLVVRRAGIPHIEPDHHRIDACFFNRGAKHCVGGISQECLGDSERTELSFFPHSGELRHEPRVRDRRQVVGDLVVLHVGGEERRDALSNQIIELTAPRAKLLIIRNDSDTDGKFAEIAKAGNIPLVVIDNVLNLRGPLQELFAGG